MRAEQIFSVEGKTALLTGASGFLGRTMGAALLENGARVIALGRSRRVEELEEQWCDEHGAGRARAYRVDMYDTASLAQTLDEIASGEGFVDVLINNAHELGSATGFNTPEGSLERATPEQFLRNLTGGVVWAALTTQKLGEQMKAEGRGSIINVSTMYANVAPSPGLYEGTDFMNPPGYSTAKAGLVALTRYVASFWGHHGVRANAILPGPFSNTEEAGPNAVLAFKREGYKRTSFDLGDAMEFATYGGFWQLARKHWQMSVGEFYRSFSKAAFVKALQRLLPELQEADVHPGGAGVRAQALEPNGALVDDFRIIESDRMVHVLNAPSPAATASISIGKEIAQMAEKSFHLVR